MSNHHRKRKTVQIGGKTCSAAVAHGDMLPCYASELTGPEEIQTRPAVDDRATRLWAYQIYGEKGGSALDNWLQAERLLKGRGGLKLS